MEAFFFLNELIVLIVQCILLSPSLKHSAFCSFAEHKHGSVFGSSWSLKKTKLRQAARSKSNTQHMFTGL